VQGESARKRLCNMAMKPPLQTALEDNRVPLEAQHAS
jgi:hypothetical protein